MHLVYRRCGFVAHLVAANHFHAAIFREYLHIQFDRFDHRTRQIFIFQIFLFIIGEEFFGLVAGFIAVEDFEIIISVAARPDHRHDRRADQSERCAAKAGADAL